MRRPRPDQTGVAARQPADHDLVALVRAGAAGDPIALGHLVDRFDGTLRGVARSYRLSSWDADDVIQATWLQFMRHGRKLREPAAVSGWLVTTARRESLRVLQRHVREQLAEDPARGESSDHGEPACELIAAERSAVLDGAVAELPEPQRGLMRVLLRNPELSYKEVGRLLAMPVGSIGPTRARSLERLRRSRQMLALRAAGA
jgi:RNA polymerase sigma factor (sigma-70 family)